MELRQIEAFVAVAEELHFTRAADRLQMAQSPLSQRIKALERELGVRLLDRTNRSVALTEAGTSVLREARATLRAAEATRRTADRARDGETGVLRIGFVASAAFLQLPDLLRSARDRVPEAEIDLRRLSSAAQLEALAADDIDLGIARTAPTDHPDLETQALDPEPLVAVLPSEHRLAAARSVAIADLADDPWILAGADGRTALVVRVRRVCAVAGFEPRIAHESPDLPSVLGLVAGGLGVSLVPLGVARIALPGTTVVPLRRQDRTALPACLIWRGRSERPVLRRLLSGSSARGPMPS